MNVAGAWARGAGARLARRRAVVLPRRTVFVAPPEEKLSMKEFKIARKQRKQFFPPGHHEFIDLLNKMEEKDYDMDHPAIEKAVVVCQRAHEEGVCLAIPSDLFSQAYALREKEGKSTLAYHLNKRLRRKK